MQLAVYSLCFIVLTYLCNCSQSPITCTKAGSILRAGTGRVVGLSTDRDGSVLACFGADNNLELFEVKSDEEAKLKMKKRLRKQRKKQIT